jgi:hypothetical protein
VLQKQEKYMTTCLPSLDELRPQLGIPEINTGRQFYLTTPSGIVTDDLEGLHGVSDEYGRLRLYSGTEFSQFLYRGQPQVYSPCLPTLARFQSIEERLLALCRNAAFEDTLSEHPLIRLCEQITVLECSLYIDKQGLAQHYGLATDIIDLTSNFDVASFFATSQLVVDNNKPTYQPIYTTDEPGVIYRINYAIYVSSEMPATLETIGWQPIKRPEQQRACGMRMKQGLDFCALPTVEMIKFRQVPEVTTRIWKYFDKGSLLFPHDAAAELAEQAKVLTQFTRKQLDNAWKRLDEWDGESRDIDQRQGIEVYAGITVTKLSTLKWDCIDVERDGVKLVNQLQETMSKVRYRRAMYLPH